MADAVEKQEVFEFPTTISQAFEMYQNVAKSLKVLAGREKALKKFLGGQIPLNRKTEDDKPFGVREGVVHFVVEGVSTSYKNALDEIVLTLLPERFHAKAVQIVESCTKPKAPSHRFRVADESEEYFDGA